MPRRYPVEFRHKVLNLIESGKPVAEIAARLGVSTTRSTTGVPRVGSIGDNVLACRPASQPRAGGGVTAHP